MPTVHVFFPGFIFLNVLSGQKAAFDFFLLFLNKRFFWYIVGTQLNKPMLRLLNIIMRFTNI